MTFRLPAIVMSVVMCLVTDPFTRAWAGHAKGDDGGQKEVVFAVGEWPPMVGENMPGFGIHAKRVIAVFSALGYHPQLEFLSWQRAFEHTRKGDYVATFSWLAESDRPELFYVPDHPIAHAYQKAFYKKSRFAGGLNVSSIEDLAIQGLRPVGVMSYWYEAAYRRLGIEAEMVTNPEAAWRFLQAGRADLYIEEEKVGRHDLKMYLGSAAESQFAASAPLKTDDMFILFSRHHPDGKRLLQEFDQFMETEQGQKMCRGWGGCLTGPDASDR